MFKTILFKIKGKICCEIMGLNPYFSATRLSFLAILAENEVFFMRFPEKKKNHWQRNTEKQLFSQFVTKKIPTQFYAEWGLFYKVIEISFK